MVRSNSVAAIQTSAAAFLCLALFTLTTPAFASGTSTKTTPQERATIAQQFVGQKLATWQDRLNLKDWNIQVELVRASQLEPRTLGNIHWDANVKKAKIDVLSSYDYTLPFAAMLNDMEFTVVHELVHLRIASLPRSEASRRDEERAVNELTRTLLNLAKH